MLLRSLLASLRSDRSRRRVRKPRRARLGTLMFPEHLEHRILPTSFSAANVSATPASYSAANVSDLIADINAANKRGGSNTITLTAPVSSPYVLTAVDNTQYGPTGLPVIGGGKKADSLTIIGNGDIIQGSGLNSPPTFRLLAVASNGSLTLKNMTLTGGNATVDGKIGGGAICNLGTLVLDAVNVTGNEITGAAGTVGVLGGPSYAAVGGGVWSSGSLTVKDGSVFADNIAMGSGVGAYEIPSDARGGAIYIAGGNATLSNTTITGNYADTPIGPPATTAGNGIYIAGGIVYIDTFTIANGEDVVGPYMLLNP